MAPRGIHVEGIAHVVNYDLPQVPEDFIHRVGRTGRAVPAAVASTFSTRAERSEIRKIERMLNIRMIPATCPQAGRPIPTRSPPSGPRSSGHPQRRNPRPLFGLSRRRRSAIGRHQLPAAILPAGRCVSCYLELSSPASVMNRECVSSPRRSSFGLRSSVPDKDLHDFDFRTGLSS